MAYSWKVFRQKTPTIRVIPTIRVRLGKCALIGQFKQYLEFIHVIKLKGGQSKNLYGIVGITRIVGVFWRKTFQLYAVPPCNAHAD